MRDMGLKKTMNHRQSISFYLNMSKEQNKEN